MSTLKLNPDAGVAVDGTLDPNSTHSQVAEKLKARKAQNVVDVTKLEPYDHKYLDIRFYIGPMKYDDHRKWKDLIKFEDNKHETEGRGIEDPVDRNLSDTFLLSATTFTGDGLLVTKDMVSTMFELQGCGPDSFEMLSIAERLNPPREYLAHEVAILLNARSIDCVVWRILINAGLVKVLVDYMSTHATEEEKEWASKELIKVEEVAYALSPIYDAEDAAKRMDVTLKEGMSLISKYGSVEAATIAIREQMQLSSENNGEE